MLGKRFDTMTTTIQDKLIYIYSGLHNLGIPGSDGEVTRRPDDVRRSFLFSNREESRHERLSNREEFLHEWLLNVICGVRPLRFPSGRRFLTGEKKKNVYERC